jgi:hypothetical protein
MGTRLKPPKVTLDKIEQTIDLEELFGVDLSDNDAIKNAIGQVLIDQMLVRVADGAGIGGVKLKSPYSDSYAKSVEFKAAGKSKGKVNMNLTGDMLASVNMKADGNALTLYVDDTQVAKAYNHIVGDTVPKRPWFGFSKDELKGIRKEFAPKIKRAKKGDDAGGSDTLLNEVAQSILEDLEDE